MLLLLAAEGKGSRELPVARDHVLPALSGLLQANASYASHQVAQHTGEPYIAERRKLYRPIIEDVLVRTADDPERLRSLSEIMVRDEDGRFEQTVPPERRSRASVLIVFADWVLDALDAPADEAGTAFVVLDAAPFLQVGSRRLLSWLAVRAAPPVDAKAQLPSEVPRPPSNTVSERIDLNHTSVRDFGRHGCDLDRVCKDIREDFCGEHGLAEIDRRIHSAQAVWSGGVLQLWLCWRTARELPNRGGLPRRLAARQRWRSRQQTAPVTGRQQTAPVTGRQRCRQNAGHAEASRVRTRRCERGAPKIVALARSQTDSGDDGTG